MRYQFFLILDKDVWRDVKTEVNPEKKLNFQTIHFGNKDSTNFGIISVVVVRIVEELGCQEYGCHTDSMHIKF